MSKTIEERLKAIEDHIGLNRGPEILKRYQDKKNPDIKWSVIREADSSIACNCNEYALLNRCEHVEKYNKGE